MVIAPKRKTKISAVFPKWWSNVSSTRCILSACNIEEKPSTNPCLLESNQFEKLSTPSATIAQHIDIIINAGISLSNFRLCSKVIPKYPSINTMMMMISI